MPELRSTIGRQDHRRNDIQGLRAVAVLLVIGFHAGLPMPGGFVGVDVFFVISGFVITALLMREHTATGRLDLAAFYRRRFRRLTPALAAVVSATALSSVLLLAPFGTQQIAAKTALGAIGLVANLVIAGSTGGYFEPAAESNPLLHTWSLSVEEQFYLVFPALLLLGWRSTTQGHRRLLAPVPLVVGGSLVSFAAMLAGSSAFGTPPWLLGFYSPVPRFWEFAIGALLALAAHRLRPGSRASAALSVAGLAVLVVTALTLGGSATYPGLATLFPVLGTALLIVGGSHPHPVRRVLTAAAMVRIGDLSYSLYLWHWPLIVLARNLLPEHAWVPLVGAVVSVVPAMASYHWLEQPLRRRPQLSRGVVVVIVLTPVILGAGLGVGAREGWGVDRVARGVSASANDHQGYVDCLDLSTSGGPAAAYGPRCTFGASEPGAPVYLVGDSNAAQYSEAVIGAARSLGRPTVIRTAAACPFFDVYLGTETGRGPGDLACRTDYEQTVAMIRQGPPSTVVIAESASQWLLPGRAVGRTPDALSSEGTSRSRALVSGLDATVAALRAAGHRVVLVLPMFWLGQTPDPITIASCPTLLSVLSGSCPGSVSLAATGPAQPRLRAEVAAVATRTGSRTVNVLQEQCPAGRCASTSQGVDVYSDSGHLSPALVERLTPRFATALGAG